MNAFYIFHSLQVTHCFSWLSDGLVSNTFTTINFDYDLAVILTIFFVRTIKSFHCMSMLRHKWHCLKWLVKFSFHYLCIL